VEGKLKTLTPQLTPAQFSSLRQAFAAGRGVQAAPVVIASPTTKGGVAGRPQVAPANFGPSCSSAGLPPGCITYTNARVANWSVNSAATTAAQPVGGMPYVATGKLLIATTTPGVFNSSCSASLIGKGLIVTAAHCVHDYGRGTAGFYKSWRFIPAQNNSTSNSGPYGFWNGANAYIPTVYLNGTDNCSVRGIVCSNDVAVIRLSPNSAGQLPWAVSQIYYYGRASNTYGFRPEGASGVNRSQITQLGYPAGLDNAFLMQRGDSQAQSVGSGSTGSPFNLLIGSQMNGGSSGGPWLTNFGTPATVTGSGAGAAPDRGTFNGGLVQATTSWGYVSNAIQIQGASTFAQNAQFPLAAYGAFGAGNIGALVQAACLNNTASPWC
jgi:hypothetical protein